MEHKVITIQKEAIAKQLIAMWSKRTFDDLMKDDIRSLQAYITRLQRDIARTKHEKKL